MKKIITLALLIAASMQSSGQATQFSIGVEGGPGLVTLTGSPALKDMKSIIRWSAGLTFQYRINKRLSLIAAPAYAGKGAKAPMSILILDTITGASGGAITPHLHYNYLTLPLMIRYTFGRRIKYYGSGGPYISYLLGRRDIAKGENIAPLTLYEGKDIDQAWDFGISLGAGISIPVLKRVSVSLEIRNSTGLYNTCKKGNAQISTIKTQATRLLAGLEYRL